MIRIFIVLCLIVMLFTAAACDPASSVFDDSDTPDTNVQNGAGGQSDTTHPAPAEDLLYIEFYGTMYEDGTFESLVAVMFVFDGNHEFFDAHDINHFGRLLSFDSLSLTEHRYTINKSLDSVEKVIVNENTGFLVYFGAPIINPGVYIISFEYLGIQVETEPAIVTG